MLALSYHLSFGLPVAILRPFNVFGPGQSARSVIPTIITQALHRRILQLGATETIRDYTYVEDTVDAFVRAGLRGPVGEPLNVGTGRGHRIGEIVERVGQMLGKKLKVKQVRERMRPATSEVEKLVCDAAPARKALGWAPKVAFEEGLERTVEWIRAHEARYKRDIFNL
jgi:dTDP-glucose 4,6-dehydratase